MLHLVTGFRTGSAPNSRIWSLERGHSRTIPTCCFEAKPSIKNWGRPGNLHGAVLWPVLPLFDLRGVLELLFGAVHLEAIGLFIAGQHRPWDRIVILADAEEAPQSSGPRRRCGGRCLFDHKPLDLSDALALRVIDRSSFGAVACDQGRGSFALRRGCALHCSHHMIVVTI